MRVAVPDIDPLCRDPGASVQVLFDPRCHGLDVARRIIGLAQVQSQNGRIRAAVNADGRARANLPLWPIVGVRRAAKQDIDVAAARKSVVQADLAIGVCPVEAARSVGGRADGCVRAGTMLDEQRR